MNLKGLRRAGLSLAALAALFAGGCELNVFVPQPLPPPAPPKDYGPYHEAGKIQGFGTFSNAGLGFSANRANGIIEYFVTKADTGVVQRYYDYGNMAAHYDKAVWQFPAQPTGTDIGQARADFNKDGLQDFLRLVPGNDHIVLYRNIGNNQYTPYDGGGQLQEVVSLSPINPFSPTALAVADWNGDGQQEFAVVAVPEYSPSGIIPMPTSLDVMLYSEGNLRLLMKIERETPLNWLGLAAVDYDGDGDIDLIVKFADESFARLYLNQDSSLF
jgi:hypothetical protein